MSSVNVSADGRVSNLSTKIATAMKWLIEDESGHTCEKANIKHMWLLVNDPLLPVNNGWLSKA